jgi:hypothetical protein
MKHEGSATTDAAELLQRQRIAMIKARFAKWFDETGGGAVVRTRLLRGIEVMLAELDRRSGWSEAMTVALDNSASLAIFVRGTRFQAMSCADCLAVCTIVPGWGFGWRSVLRDEEVYNILSWFAHFARQYIHRSDVAKILMIAWETDGRILHPFGSKLLSQRHGAVSPSLSVAEALEHAATTTLASWGYPQFRTEPEETISDWSARNTLDPFVHQAIFHFLRAQKLRESGFDIEAIVAFDCAMESLGALLIRRRGLGSAKNRDWICRELGLPADREELANHVYFLRNEFGAHAGGWRWWDQGELLAEELMGEVSDLVAAALRVSADAEPSMRSVEPDPADWAAWFVDNFEMLWNAVWYERLDAAHA